MPTFVWVFALNTTQGPLIMTDYSKTEINFLPLAQMPRRRVHEWVQVKERVLIVFFTSNMFVLKISSPFS